MAGSAHQWPGGPWRGGHVAVRRETDSRAETAGKGHRAGPIGPDQREQVILGTGLRSPHERLSSSLGGRGAVRAGGSSRK